MNLLWQANKQQGEDLAPTSYFQWLTNTPLHFVGARNFRNSTHVAESYEQPASTTFPPSDPPQTMEVQVTYNNDALPAVLWSLLSIYVGPFQQAPG